MSDPRGPMHAALDREVARSTRHAQHRVATLGRSLLVLEQAKTGNKIYERNAWMDQVAHISALPFHTIKRWWQAFGMHTALQCTPRQATQEHRSAFYAWLDEQAKEPKP